MKKLNKEPFARQAIHTSCNAFFREDFFSFQEGEMGQEYYGEMSCGKEPPQWEFLNERVEGMDIGADDIQGRFYFLKDSASDLELVCQSYLDKNEDYFVFFNVDLENENECGWVIWSPNEEAIS